MEKTVLTKTLKNYYKAKSKPELVTLGSAQYVSIRGKGDPNEVPFSNKVQALYTVAFGLKFIYKEQDLDFVVPKLEGLWWFDIEKYGQVNLAEAPNAVPRSEWEYRLLIQMPSFVSVRSLREAVDNAVHEKGIKLAAEVEWYKMAGGRFVQMLHTGPFNTEPETLKQIECYMRENGLQKNRLHHEIYLSDFRLTAPENFKTILREPIK
ncbi:GyrI-like domain-containing protein [Filimonas effusa]|uniref:GyrI-like small molecule binding domain-containing protein n=1 Tax=Filimonas effusa TaxID=2508721 RepID=A0A4Q1D7Z7_9BACT|nr:GyrI-like domain-containing protein [Filimonas effusa]RXK83891.1 hypothetical protein ESB13_17630 [Filimonas effusa]